MINYKQNAFHHQPFTSSYYSYKDMFMSQLQPTSHPVQTLCSATAKTFTMRTFRNIIIVQALKLINQQNVSYFFSYINHTVHIGSLLVIVCLVEHLMCRKIIFEYSSNLSCCYCRVVLQNIWIVLFIQIKMMKWVTTINIFPFVMFMI